MGRNANLGDMERRLGVTKPTMTGIGVREWQTYYGKDSYSQLFSQFEAVDRAAPRLRMVRGKTSLGRIHAIGP